MRLNTHGAAASSQWACAPRHTRATGSHHVSLWPPRAKAGRRKKTMCGAPGLLGLTRDCASKHRDALQHAYTLPHTHTHTHLYTHTHTMLPWGPAVIAGITYFTQHLQCLLRGQERPSNLKVDLTLMPLCCTHWIWLYRKKEKKNFTRGVWVQRICIAIYTQGVKRQYERKQQNSAELINRACQPGSSTGLSAGRQWNGPEEVLKTHSLPQTVIFWSLRKKNTLHCTGWRLKGNVESNKGGWQGVNNGPPSEHN